MTKLLLTVACVLVSLCAAAQGRTLKGKVISNEGRGVPAASVKLTNANQGTTTDNDGHFSLHVQDGKVSITVSAIGYTPQTIDVAAGETSVEVSLAVDPRSLDAVVVTALGIGRKSRSLTYSTQSVGTQELTTVKNTNVVNSLNGKIAGVQINRTSSGAGGSVRVVIRGDKSTRNSQPLYVIDGMPVTNPIGGPDPGLYNTAPDAGDIMSSINPEDIESINVLKGASASALYGSQGSNGVILITTKKGKSGAAKVDFSSSFTVDRASILPKLQFEYGQSDPATATKTGSDDSWGAKGASMPGKNYVKDFFRTGSTFINSVSLTSGTERSSNYLSYSNTTNSGILPTSTFGQHTLSFRQTNKFLNDKLILEGTFLGSIQKAHNRLNPGVYFNPLTGLYLFPRGLDFNAYKNFEYFSDSRYLNAQNWWNINHEKELAYGGGWGGQDYQQNPYWVLNRNPVDNKITNTYGSLSLKYLINSWLTIQARGNYNKFITEYERDIYATTQATLAQPNGLLRTKRGTNTTMYGDVLLLGERKVSQDLTIGFTVGSSIQDQKDRMLEINGMPAVPNVFLESALDRNSGSFDIKNTPAISRQVQSVFGSVQLNWQNKFYLDLSDRNDWSSTLAFTSTKKKGYNYYSVGGSAVLSEIFNMPAVVNLAKVRASYAVVGNDIQAFTTQALYTFQNGGTSVPPVSKPLDDPRYELKPEKNKSVEIGTQWSLFDNKLSLDLTWYQSKVYNQFFTGVAVSGGSSTGVDINAGLIRNTGFEASVSYKVVSNKTFSWTTNVNASANRNKIVEVLNKTSVASFDDDSKYGLQFSGGYTKLKAGGSFGDMYGRMLRRDAQGRVMYNSATKLPFYTEDSLIGNPAPKFILGWNNSINFKNFTLSFLIDGKFGGKVLSITEGYLDQMGVSKRTADARNAGGKVNVSGVDQDGKPWSGQADADKYYKSNGGKTPVGDYYSYSATAVRLREISISYKLPISGNVIKDMRVSLIGNNLFFFKRDAPFDPEQVAGVNAGGTGIDAFGFPAYRSFGINLKCTF